MTTRAEAFLRLCKLDKALDDVNEVLEANPIHSHALAVRGDAMFQVQSNLNKKVSPQTTRSGC